MGKESVNPDPESKHSDVVPEKGELKGKASLGLQAPRKQAKCVRPKDLAISKPVCVSFHSLELCQAKAAGLLGERDPPATPGEGVSGPLRNR